MKSFVLLFLFTLILYTEGNSQFYNTATGTGALANLTGSYYNSHNTATGSYALYYSTYILGHSAHGSSALFNNIDGYYNSSFGSFSSYNNTSGGANFALGYESLKANTTANSNISLGVFSLYNSNSSYNTAIGYKSLFSTTSGSNNVGIGNYAGWRNQTGSNNTYIAGDNFSATNLNNATAIGANSFANVSNSVLVGSSSTTVIGGSVNWSTISDKRIKTNIQYSVPGLKFIMLLRPVTYEFDYKKLKKFRENHNGRSDLDFNTESNDLRDKKVYTGLISQEVLLAASKIGYQFSGISKPENDNELIELQYEAFIMPLINAIKEISSKNTNLTEKIEKVQRQIIALRKEVEQILKK